MTIALSFGFVSCDVETNEEPGGTNVQNMAGRWTVSVSQVDENGNVVFEPEDLFGVVDVDLFTFNTSANSSTEMWIDDDGNFWDFKFKMPINYGAGTFSAPDIYYNDDMREIAELIAAGPTRMAILLQLRRQPLQMVRFCMVRVITFMECPLTVSRSTLRSLTILMVLNSAMPSTT